MSSAWAGRPGMSSSRNCGSEANFSSWRTVCGERMLTRSERGWPMVDISQLEGGEGNVSYDFILLYFSTDESDMIRREGKIHTPESQ